MGTLGRTAKYYRENPEARKKHQITSKKWNQSEEGKAYKKDKNATPSEKAKQKARVEARSKFKNIPDGYVVDHKKPLAKGGSNNKSNLRVVSARVNNTKNKK
jgi:5-methylcytosine-specific restriction endonuclease McrA